MQLPPTSDSLDDDSRDDDRDDKRVAVCVRETICLFMCVYMLGICACACGNMDVCVCTRVCVLGVVYVFSLPSFFCLLVYLLFDQPF